MTSVDQNYAYQNYADQNYAYQSDQPNQPDQFDKSDYFDQYDKNKASEIFKSITYDDIKKYEQHMKDQKKNREEKRLISCYQKHKQTIDKICSNIRAKIIENIQGYHFWRTNIKIYDCVINFDHDKCDQMCDGLIFRLRNDGFDAKKFKHVTFRGIKHNTVYIGNELSILYKFLSKIF